MMLYTGENGPPDKALALALCKLPARSRIIFSPGHAQAQIRDVDAKASGISFLRSTGLRSHDTAKALQTVKLGQLLHDGSSTLKGSIRNDTI